MKANSTKKSFTLKIVLSALPLLAIAFLFSFVSPRSEEEFNSNTDENQLPAGETQVSPLDPQFDYAFDFVTKYTDSTKQTAHLVWWNTRQIKINKFVVERSINHDAFVPVSSIDYTDRSAMTDVMDMDLDKMLETDKYNKILFTTEKNGWDGFIYNEMYENNDFFNSDIRYRIRAEMDEDKINYSDIMGNIRSNPGKFQHKKAHWFASLNQPVNSSQNVIIVPADNNVSPLSDSGLRAACLANSGSVPGGTCSSSYVTTTCDCCGSYKNYTYTDPCTASPPDPYKVTGCDVNCDTGFIYPGCSGDIKGTDCACACDCAFDDCCQHSCSGFATCGCKPWKACQSWGTKTAITSAVIGQLSITGSSITSDCPCSNDINITVSSTCASASLLYDWSNGATTQDLTNVCDGGYSVNITSNAATAGTCKTSGSYTVPACALPVTLVHFGVEAKERVVQVNWATASEVSNDYFTVERSYEGTNFSPIETVDGAGNSTDTRYYSVTDEEPLMGASYYRLKLTDFAGSSQYSSIMSIYLQQWDLFTVTPNPTKGKVDIIFYTENENVGVTITDYTGRRVFQKNFSTATGMYKVEADISQYASGIYFVTFTYGGNKKLTRKLVKN